MIEIHMVIMVPRVQFSLLSMWFKRLSICSRTPSTLAILSSKLALAFILALFMLHHSHLIGRLKGVLVTSDVEEPSPLLLHALPSLAPKRSLARNASRLHVRVISPKCRLSCWFVFIIALLSSTLYPHPTSRMR